MKRMLICLAMSTALTVPASAQDVKLGLLLGFTGPLESVAPDMAAGAELAIKEVNDSGLFLNGSKITTIRADSTCVDAGAATAAAERLVSSDKVSAIIGDTCSGASAAVLTNVALPKGVVMVSPSATSPALSTLKSNGFFYRTASSDARQGEILAAIMKDHGVKTAAITYTNNDYGKGLSDSIKTNFEKLGGKVTIVASHEDGKADYSAEVASLASAGGDVLVVAGYLDQGGKGIVRASLDAGAFEKFVLPDGMIGDSLVKAIGKDLNGSFGDIPGSNSNGAEIFKAMVTKAGFKVGPYSAESYDAAALTLLAMQASKSSEGSVFKNKIMEVANGPGEQILPGELAKGLKILAEGGKIDYVGATNVKLVPPGESAGNFREILVKDGALTTVGYR
ncbi:ABC transporter substrate-binding protein [Rhizobium sp. C1]|uniref:ABC transporter substrate-binding protein n=1 Tax=Rhizobium sp. C1 TaxID=1349799 RepID=UPI001E58AB50|nr:ABC transporter substrate-binding protein [Rhizobium sp. C1]MCD2177374.1 ABC transporter substrate-binding protein [Rhizobium sp. C1]